MARGLRDIGYNLTGAPPEEDTDWIARSTAAGVFLSTRLDSAADLADWVHVDASQISIDPTLKPHESTNGSMKFEVLNSNGTTSGQVSVPLGASYGEGDTIWISYRVKAPPEFSYAPWPTSPDPEGAKLTILSRDAHGPLPQNSNIDSEVVVQMTLNSGQLHGYWRDGVSTAVHEYESYSSAANGSDFKWQPSVDNGTNPLTGTNPDTGAAWSTWEQQRKQFGLLYSSYGNPGASNYVKGLGDPFSGGFRLYPDEWITVTFRVKIGNWSTFNSRYTCWAARENGNYVLLWDKNNIRIGSSGASDYNGINLLPYVSNRVAGGRRISSRTSNISGVTLHTCGLSTPLGAGTLEYNATTQRFRWSGNGESFGTARGFSAANGILVLNVIAGSGSYICLTVNPAALPSAGTITDTVTIADGRPDTQINYSDLIGSTSPINAPVSGDVPILPGMSALEAAASTLAANAWTSITVNGMTESLMTGGTTDSIISYAKTGYWDQNLKRIYFWGYTHSDPAPTKFGRRIRYISSTNTWEVDQDNIPDPAGADGHGYYHECNRPSDGRQFHRRYESNLCFTRLPASSSWTSLPNIPGSAFDSYQVANALCWHPGLNSGTGGLVFVGPNWVYALNSAMTSWSSLANISNMNGPYSNGAVYNQTDGLVYFGGGNVHSTKFYQIAANGTVTLKAAPPFGIGVTDGLGPIIGGASGNLVAISTTGSIREYNPTTNTWSAQISSLPFTTGDGDYFAVPIPEYGVIAFIVEVGGHTPSTSMYLWKH